MKEIQFSITHRNLDRISFLLAISAACSASAISSSSAQLLLNDDVSELSLSLSPSLLVPGEKSTWPCSTAFLPVSVYPAGAPGHWQGISDTDVPAMQVHVDLSSLRSRLGDRSRLVFSVQTPESLGEAYTGAAAGVDGWVSSEGEREGEFSEDWMTRKKLKM